MTVIHDLKRKINLLLDKPLRIDVADQNREKLAANDIILLSYPRSGNTWTRYLLADLILQSHGFETTTDLPINFANIIPTTYSQDISKEIDSSLNLPYRIVKSHHFQDLGSRKCIYVFRRAEDVLCSYYHFVSAKKNPLIEAQFMPVFYYRNISVDEFCQKNIQTWKRHVGKILKKLKDNPEKIALVCYEDLHKKTPETLRCLASFLGLSVNDAAIERAIENHAFNKRVSALKQSGQESERVFSVRKGKPSSSHEELSTKTLEKVISQTRQIYDEARSLCQQELVL